MITKERLEELIKEKKQIWKFYKEPCQQIYQIPAGLFGIGFNSQVDDTTPFDELFETKEDAEEYVEFGNITKTIQLNYVSWEEFKNRDRNFSFRAYPYDYYCYTDGRYVEIKEYYRSSDRVIFSKKLTRENYNEARRLCVKLFKGEE